MSIDQFYEGKTEYVPCPRCAAEILEVGPTVNGYLRGALSRATRDDGAAPVFVCSRCGSREAVRQFCLKPPIIPLTEWPVETDLLLDEERVLLACRPRRMLGEAVKS